VLQCSPGDWSVQENERRYGRELHDMARGGALMVGLRLLSERGARRTFRPQMAQPGMAEEVLRTCIGWPDLRPIDHLARRSPSPKQKRTRESLLTHSLRQSIQERLPRDGTALYCISEALANGGAYHAKATAYPVGATDGQGGLVVEDNGIG
jgi:hypothetical protein